MSGETLLYLSVAILTWGAGAIFDKLVLKYLSPLDAFYLRLFVMMVFFAFIIFLRLGYVINDIKKAHYHAYIFTFLGIFMAMAGVFAYLRAMSAEEASKIVPLSSTYPLITLILAVLFLGESFSYVKLAGTFLIIVGVYLISR